MRPPIGTTWRNATGRRFRVVDVIDDPAGKRDELTGEPVRLVRICELDTLRDRFHEVATWCRLDLELCS